MQKHSKPSRVLCEILAVSIFDGLMWFDCAPEFHKIASGSNSCFCIGIFLLNQIWFSMGALLFSLSMLFNKIPNHAKKEGGFHRRRSGGREERKFKNSTGTGTDLLLYYVRIFIFLYCISAARLYIDLLTPKLVSCRTILLWLLRWSLSIPFPLSS